MGPPCKNYWLCDSDYDNHSGGTRAGVKKLCINCDIMFGKELELTVLSECPVCMNEECIGCNFPNCKHSVCRDCFKRMHYGDEDLVNEPKFPYNSEIEEEYWETDWRHALSAIRTIQKTWRQPHKTILGRTDASEDC